MAAVVSQHARHLGSHLGILFQTLICIINLRINISDDVIKLTSKDELIRLLVLKVPF